MLELALHAVRGIRHRRVRSWLTMLGIFVGIAAVVALLSLSEGLKVAVAEQFAKIGGDKIIIQPKGSFGGFESDAARLTVTDAKEVTRVTGVKEVAVYILQGARLSLTDENIPVYLASLPDDDTRDLLIEAFALEPKSGKWPVRGKARQAIVGHALANNNALKHPLKTGDKILVNDVAFDVSGVFERTGDPGTDNSVAMSEASVREVAGLDDEFASFLLVRMVQGAEVDAVRDRITRELRKTHQVDAGKEDFDVQTPEDILAVFNTIAGIIQAVLVGIAAISLLVGGIGIMNTMYTAVLERTNEIGVMKAVGARNQDILTLFIVESGLLGLVGGLIGLVLGMLLSKAVEIVAWQVLGSPLIRAVFPVSVMIGAVVFAVLIGVVSGMLPAYQAARLPPVEALRYE